MNDAQIKFEQLLRELFQFDCADLDFGIYRIMNHKREVIERFITENLPQAIAEERERGALAEQSRATQELEAARKKVFDALGDDALDAERNLAEKYSDTKAGQEYLAAQAKAAGARDRQALEAAIYNHLYTFFSRYYQDGDFISKRRYSKRERYAIPYNGEEVYLYWANHDQYYIKTAEYFTDYTYKAPNGVTVHFKLQAADVEQDNVKGEKRFFLPCLDEIARDETDGEVVIPFEYRPLTQQEAIAYGKSKQQDKIIAEGLEAIPRRLAKSPRALAALTAERRKTADGDPVSYLEHHLRQYTRRNTSDFFIHKDLQGFLSRELDFYLKNEVLNLEEMEAAGEGLAEGWFQMLRLIKAVGNRIIAFLAQIENFQKMLWEKRKFITETFYCITVGQIDEAFYPEIAACEAQWEEWKTLFHIDDQSGDRLAFLKAHPTLVLDTCHFSPDFVDRLLASYDDLDELTDGLLVHGENWQALNLLLEKYREGVKCVYIDPPYNTDASPIVYKNDYRRSSWVSLLSSRMETSRYYLTPDGIFVVTIDDFQQRELHYLAEMVFGVGNVLATVAIRSNPSGRPGSTGFATAHEYAIFIRASEKAVIQKLPRQVRHDKRYSERDEVGRFMWELLRKRGSGSERRDSPKLYYPIYVNAKTGILRVPGMQWDEQLREWLIEEPCENNEVAAYPVDEDGIERRWRWSVENVRNNLSQLKAVENSVGGYTIYYKYRPPAGILPTTMWIDAKYSATEHGTNVLKHFFTDYDPFSYPKSIYAVMDTIRLGGTNPPVFTVLDYFAGSGTTGHAVINLNREDGGRRKLILVEMADYFDTVLLPRLKKVTFTPEWKDGKLERLATQEEAERSPRIIKVIRLESYEDALNNIEFDDASGQQAMQFEDYLLKYMLKWETRKSGTLLNVEQLTRPFDYKLHIHRDGETRTQAVDLPETFSYLLGLHVQERHVCGDDDRRYLVYRGVTRQGRKTAVIWRETEGWQQADYERDRQFVAEHNLAKGADEVYVNGDSLIPGARALEALFKARMFAEVSL